MCAKRTTIELIAPSIEEAVQLGLNQLGLQLDDVNVEVLDEGNRGLFGLGSRQARIRLTVRDTQSPPKAKKQPAALHLEDETIPAPDEDIEDEEEDLMDQELAEELGEGILPSAESLMDDLTLHVVQETVSELLAKMKVDGEIDVRYGESDDRHPRRPVYIDIHGQDLSMLIGKKAETLNALQYIANLIVSKELGRGISLIIDIEGYRSRRYQQVLRIANRMVEQAIKTGRKQVLEPMPANERRVIHIELRKNPNVTTESVGADPYRKVTIIPVKK